ncbi:MAG: hypothetical protein ABSD42_09180 [Candidatus Bathyarchaeia archaeon]|jgi:hypothetical protein
MTKESPPYENEDDFYGALGKAIKTIIDEFKEEDNKVPRVKRTITVPEVFDTAFRRIIRAELLKRDFDVPFNDLVVALAMIAFSHLASEKIVNRICDDIDFIDATNEAKKKIQ